jgi:hypothetical protein
MGDNEFTMMPGRRTGAAAPSVTDQVSVAVNPNCPIQIDAPMANTQTNYHEWNGTPPKKRMRMPMRPWLS